MMLVLLFEDLKQAVKCLLGYLIKDISTLTAQQIHIMNVTGKSYENPEGFFRVVQNTGLIFVDNCYKWKIMTF